jgi:hypothetical protein
VSIKEADMRRTILGLSIAAFSLVGWLPSQAIAQDTKSARGTITAMAGDAITVKAGDQELKFTVDAKTILIAEGAGTAAREAAAAGKPGPKLAEFVKVGDNVEVNYREVGGTMNATRIRRVASPGPGGGMTSDQRAETSDGRVDAVTPTSLTISGSASGGAKFTQTFTIDNETKVVAVGAGTAAAKAAATGAKMTITDYVGIGDQVTVTYHKMAGSLHAAQVRVRSKAK